MEYQQSHGGGIVVADYTYADAFTPPRYRTVADCEAQDIRDAWARFHGEES
jgi:hypothetical protein